MTTITMRLNDDVDIVFEVGEFMEDGKKASEGYVYLRNHYGEIIQDIAVVRPDKTEQNTEVLVYGDVNDTDYTDKFVIPIYELDGDDL